jgi:hypothetical protein
VILALVLSALAAPATVGQPAPDFTLTDTDGKAFHLADHKGQTVVLEWFNPGCPFVQYAHGAQGPLASLPTEWLGKGVIWVAVNSGAPGKEGSGADRSRSARAEWHMGYPVLVDEAGTVGKLYGAKTTPHMFIVDPAGNLVFAGGLDNAPLGNAEGPTNAYVDAALEAVTSGRPIVESTPKAYGCSVKYGS